MASNTRKQLEAWIKTKSVVGKVVDIGGAQLALRSRINFAGETSIINLDLENPHEENEAVHLRWDMNYSMHSDAKTIYFPRRDLFGDVDYITCFEVTEYLWNPMQAFANMALLLKRGGILFISFHFVYPVHNPPAEDCLRYTREGAKKMLRNAGFEVVDCVPRMAENVDMNAVYFNEGMRPSKGYKGHQEIGCLIEARKY